MVPRGTGASFSLSFLANYPSTNASHSSRFTHEIYDIPDKLAYYYNVSPFLGLCLQAGTWLNSE